MRLMGVCGIGRLRGEDGIDQVCMRLLECDIDPGKNRDACSVESRVIGIRR